MNKLLVIVLILFSPLVLSEGNKVDATSVKSETTYLAAGNLNLRKSPPKTIFYILGEQKGLVEKADRVTVTEVKQVKTLLDTHYWLKIEKTAPNSQAVENGWVYGGKKGDKSYLQEIGNE